MHPFLANLQREAEQNPVMALAAVAAVITAASKLMDAHGRSVGSRAYARDVARRVASSQK